MDIRYAMHPEQMKGLDTGEIRRHFLIDRLFEKDEMNLVYSHIDRIIVGGVCPHDKELELKVTKELGVRFFSPKERNGNYQCGFNRNRFSNGKENVLENKECLYVGMGPKNVAFKSSDKSHPAKFYFNSTPAHSPYPLIKVSTMNAQRLNLGSPDKSNVRTINQFIHPKVLNSCQLVMGMTALEPNSMWNGPLNGGFPRLAGFSRRDRRSGGRGAWVRVAGGLA